MSDQITFATRLNSLGIDVEWRRKVGSRYEGDPEAGSSLIPDLPLDQQTGNVISGVR